jgi:hypothetical protein
LFDGTTYTCNRKLLLDLYFVAVNPTGTKTYIQLNTAGMAALCLRGGSFALRASMRWPRWLCYAGVS